MAFLTLSTTIPILFSSLPPPFCCVSRFLPGLLTKQGIHIGKMPPKIWPVVTVIIESGVAFPTKCHRRGASPHYRAGQIDHLYDASVVTGPHVDTQSLLCSRAPNSKTDLLHFWLNYLLNQSILQYLKQGNENVYQIPYDKIYF